MAPIGFIQKSGAVAIFLLLSTCDSFSPRLMASFFRSILLIYFCFWNIFSRAFLWSSEKTALLKMPLRALELESCGRRGSTLSSSRGGKKMQSPVSASGEACVLPSHCPPCLYGGQVPSSLSAARLEQGFFPKVWSRTLLRTWSGPFGPLWGKSTYAFPPDFVCHVRKSTVPGNKAPMQNKKQVV